MRVGRKQSRDGLLTRVIEMGPESSIWTVLAVGWAERTMEKEQESWMRNLI